MPTVSPTVRKKEIQFKVWVICVLFCFHKWNTHTHTQDFQAETVNGWYITEAPFCVLTGFGAAGLLPQVSKCVALSPSSVCRWCWTETSHPGWAGCLGPTVQFIKNMPPSFCYSFWFNKAWELGKYFAQTIYFLGSWVFEDCFCVVFIAE